MTNIESVDLIGNDRVIILITGNEGDSVLTLHLDRFSAIDLANSINAKLNVKEHNTDIIKELEHDLEVARREVSHYVAELNKANEYMKRQSNNSFQMGD